jgi:hypothetical protein
MKYSLCSVIIVVERTKSSSPNDNNKGIEGVLIYAPISVLSSFPSKMNRSLLMLVIVNEEYDNKLT